MAVTSLLKSAAAAQKKVLAQQDALANYDWQNSAQTYEDFTNYSKYLNDRIAQAPDVSSALTYSTTLRSAQRSYTSNEIQRATIDAMEGNGNVQTKMDSVKNLYYQAVANGDMNLAQNLVSQFDSLSIQAQNEARASAAAFASSSNKALTKQIDSLISGNDYTTLPDGTVVLPFKAIANQVKSSVDGSLLGGVNGFIAARDTLQNLQKVVEAAYNGAADQDTADAILEKYGGYIDGSKTIDFLGQKFTANDIVDAAQNEEMNNPLYSLSTKYNPATGQNENTLKRNEVETFSYSRTGQDAQGNDQYSPLNISRAAQDTGKNQSLDTRITNEGYIIGSEDQKTKKSPIGNGQTVNSDGSESIGNRLASLGYQASKADNGTINLTLPSGQTYNAVITPNGSIRFYGPPGQYSGGQAALYEINLNDQKNFGLDPATGQPYDVKAGTPREVAPDETSIFGTPSNFGGVNSRASAAGARTVAAYGNPDVLGVLKPIDLGRARLTGVASGSPMRITNTANDFTGFGGPATSALLGSANFTLQARQQEQQIAAANALQASNTFNLNQTPVQQFAQNGAPVRQLTVARPTPAPVVKVAPPVAPPRVVVGSAPNPFGQLGISGNNNGPLRVVPY